VDVEVEVFSAVVGLSAENTSYFTFIWKPEAATAV
jgi:hypothetical protein